MTILLASGYWLLASLLLLQRIILRNNIRIQLLHIRMQRRNAHVSSLLLAAAAFLAHRDEIDDLVARPFHEQLDFAVLIGGAECSQWRWADTRVLIPGDGR